MTDLAKFLGWSILQPFSTPIWYANSCSGIDVKIGVSELWISEIFFKANRNTDRDDFKYMNMIF